MKKFIHFLFFIALAWLGKLSYDFYHISQQLADIQNTLHQSEQKNATLNDQVVALQRDPTVVNSVPAKNVPNSLPSKTLEIQSIQPSTVIKQQLELVQFALQQQQYIFAVEQLVQLNLQVEKYNLADSLKNSLRQAIQKDIQAIQKFSQARDVQQEQLNHVLHQLDQAIQVEIQQPRLSPAQQNPEHFWQRWLQVQRVDRSANELVNRRLILKETQLRIILAQNALLRGEYVEYQNMLNLVIQQLDPLPDAQSQKFKQKLVQIKQMPILSVPKLNTTTVLGA
ncbi:MULTISPECIES: hypothetical protein [unclassified Acinetobacter]|uniref:hypothetical protein n=1 Tax=unclassified Acinetobacter TaxID=196816 RepID=UPI00257888B8|nr:MULTISPECIES: hypothetical protein [unclassified Acinetobacter]MDM1757986.1 hypothetical protein [Acinetobacter sp. 256-1]MDM1761416.1 hypothetical protein [Acinetobacter sp. 251-1]